MYPQSSSRRGFTIVELLVVIVVIGILAAITIVAFNGVQSRAHAAQAQSDAESVSKLLAVFNVTNGSFPIDLSAVSNGQAMSVVDGTSYSYHPGSGNSSYCVTVTNATTSYRVTDTAPSPVAGGCPGDGVNGVAAITNLVTNPSFETNLVGWNNAMKSGDVAVVSTAQANSSTHSMSLTTASSGIDSYVESYLTLQPGTYAVSGFVYLPNNGGTYGNRDALFYNQNGGLSSAPGSVAYNRTLINQWQRVKMVFTTTSAGTLGVRFYGTVGTTYIDSVMVTLGSSIANYGDGFTSNWIWNSTPNASTSTGPPS